MKIIVDSLPSCAKECLFSVKNCEYGWVCNLIPRQICEGVEFCSRLMIYDKENS